VAHPLRHVKGGAFPLLDLGLSLLVLAASSSSAPVLNLILNLQRGCPMFVSDGRTSGSSHYLFLFD